MVVGRGGASWSTVDLSSVCLETGLSRRGKVTGAGGQPTPPRGCLRATNKQADIIDHARPVPRDGPAQTVLSSPPE